MMQHVGIHHYNPFLREHITLFKREALPGTRLMYGRDIHEKRFHPNKKMITIEQESLGSISQDEAARAAASLYGVSVTVTKRLIELHLRNPYRDYEHSEEIVNHFCDELSKVLTARQRTVAAASAHKSEARSNQTVKHQFGRRPA